MVHARTHGSSGHHHRERGIACARCPQGLREGSLALGASKWQTIRKNVLPYALPGILTSSILGIARVAGETAPIMFTAAYAMKDEMPWQVAQVHRFLFPGRDGAALSHLRRQLEDSAERIHRAGSVRRRLRLSFPRHADRANLDRAARTKPESSIMVTVLEMPETPSPITVNQPAPTREPGRRARHHRNREPRFRLRDEQGPARCQPQDSAARGHRVHRTIRLRQDHLAPLPQSDERPD